VLANRFRQGCDCARRDDFRRGYLRRAVGVGTGRASERQDSWRRARSSVRKRRRGCPRIAGRRPGGSSDDMELYNDCLVDRIAAGLELDRRQVRETQRRSAMLVHRRLGGVGLRSGPEGITAWPCSSSGLGPGIRSAGARSAPSRCLLSQQETPVRYLPKDTSCPTPRPAIATLAARLAFPRSA
jgi:hypothetical protein